jgi:hypothetical protein
MICIVKFKPMAPPTGDYSAAPFIDGWLIATDVHDARRQAAALGDSNLAAELYRREFLPGGKHQITAQHVALVT